MGPRVTSHELPVVLWMDSYTQWLFSQPLCVSTHIEYWHAVRLTWDLVSNVLFGASAHRHCCGHFCVSYSSKSGANTSWSQCSLAQIPLLAYTSGMAWKPQINKNTHLRTYQGLWGNFPGAEGKDKNSLCVRLALCCTYSRDTEHVMAHTLESPGAPVTLKWKRIHCPPLEGPGWSGFSISSFLTLLQTHWSSFVILKTPSSFLAFVVSVPSTWNTLFPDPHMIGFFLSLGLRLINVISWEAPFLSLGQSLSYYLVVCSSSKRSMPVICELTHLIIWLLAVSLYAKAISMGFLTFSPSPAPAMPWT